MKSTVRDVLLLGGAMAAFMLLVVMAPVGAEEVAPAAAPEVRVAANATHATARPASPQVAVDAAATASEVDAPASEVARREGRCDQVRRIGKFTLTRCD
jgi:hypothetical protein